MSTPIMFLAQNQIKLDDIARSAQQNWEGSPNSGPVLLVVVCLVAVVLLIVAINAWRHRDTTPKALNNPGKLLKEMMRNVPLRPAEMKQLKILAEHQSCTSPLVPLLCPSLLARGLRDNSLHADRQVLIRVARKMGLMTRLPDADPATPTTPATPPTAPANPA